MRVTLFTLLLCGACVYGADNPFVGTWKLNSAKSTLEGPGSRAVHKGVAKYELDSAGRLLKTLDGYDDRQRSIRNEDVIAWNGCDGVEHPVNSIVTMLARSATPSSVTIQDGTVPAVDAQDHETLVAHYPFAPPESSITASCTQNGGSPLLTTLVRQSGKLIKTTVSMISADGTVLTEITTAVSNDGNTPGEYLRVETVWDKQ